LEAFQTGKYVKAFYPADRLETFGSRHIFVYGKNPALQKGQGA